MELSKSPYIEFDYVNWKGIEGHRKVIADSIYYGSTEFHKEPQWLLKAKDVDKNENRTFAMKEMKNVKHW